MIVLYFCSRSSPAAASAVSLQLIHCLCDTAGCHVSHSQCDVTWPGPGYQISGSDLAPPVQQYILYYNTEQRAGRDNSHKHQHYWQPRSHFLLGSAVLTKILLFLTSKSQMTPESKVELKYPSCSWTSKTWPWPGIHGGAKPCVYSGALSRDHLSSTFSVISQAAI